MVVLLGFGTYGLLLERLGELFCFDGVAVFLEPAAPAKDLDGRV